MANLPLFGIAGTSNPQAVLDLGVGIVYFPPGTYSGPITVKFSGQRLIGAAQRDETGSFVNGGGGVAAIEVQAGLTNVVIDALNGSNCNYTVRCGAGSMHAFLNQFTSGHGLIVATGALECCAIKPQKGLSPGSRPFIDLGAHDHLGLVIPNAFVQNTAVETVVLRGAAHVLHCAGVDTDNAVINGKYGLDFTNCKGASITGYDLEGTFYLGSFRARSNSLVYARGNWYNVSQTADGAPAFFRAETGSTFIQEGGRISGWSGSTMMATTDGTSRIHIDDMSQNIHTNYPTRLSGNVYEFFDGAWR